MYTIRECSRITSLSIKALRIYHEKGLLIPAVVDRATGYRYYSSENIQKAQVIRQLRDMQFGLDDIKGLLEAGTDEEAVFACLEKQKQAMRARMEESKAIIQALDTILEAEKEAQTIMEQQQFEVLEQTVDEMLIAGIRYKGKYCECGEKFGALFRKMGGNAAGKPMNLYYDGEYKEEDADIESCIPIKKEKAVEGIDIRPLPGGKCLSLLHKGPYEELGRSYEKLFNYIKEKGYKTALPSREIYLKGPGMFFRGNPKKYITEIQVMLEA